MGRKFIKWIGLVMAVAVLISLYYYVGDKKKKILYSPDEALKLAKHEINDNQNYPRAIELLEQVLPASTRYADVHALLGKSYFLNHNPVAAQKELLYALKLDKKNEAALLNLIALSLSQHDTAAALSYADRYLVYHRTDRSILLKKYSLYLKTRNETAARKLYDSLYRLGLGDTLQKITAYHRLALRENSGPMTATTPAAEDTAAGRLSHRQTISRSAKGSAGISAHRIEHVPVHNEEPAQKDAMLQEINASISAARYDAALQAVDRALRYYPNDRDFINKKTGILTDTRNYAAAIHFLDSLPEYNTDPTFKALYSEISIQQATALIRVQRYAAAVPVIEKALQHDPSNIGLLQQALNAYAASGNTQEAISAADKLISADPGNPVPLFKKAGLLEMEQRYEEAAAITRELAQHYPSHPEYRQAMADEITAAQKQALSAGQFQRSLSLFHQLVAAGNPGKLSFQYAAAAYAEQGDSTQVLLLIDSALQRYPGDSLFLVKKAGALAIVNRYPEALAVSGTLAARYPSDSSLQQFYLDQLFSAGKYYERGKKMDTALALFLTALPRSPADTFTLQNLSAIYYTRRQYDSSIFYAQLGLRADSNNAYLLMKEAAAYEQLKEYPQALKAASRAIALQAGTASPGYIDYLRSKTFLNQVGIMHLQSVFSSPDQFASITGIHYMRRFKRSSVAARLNLGERPAGTGVQGGLDIYLTHNTRYYSNIFVNLSTGTAFPYRQIGYSLYRNLPKDWELEFGGRYLGFDTAQVFTAVTALSKYFENNWLTLRGFYSRDALGGYASAVFSMRHYLNDKKDYVSFVAGSGRTPDDPALVSSLNNYRGYQSNTVGIGFQKVFRFRTFLQVSVNYTNLSIPAKRSLNQYDFYLSLLRNF
ncbi:MAG: YaiO family outer membrane beta-barrel protein [Chitinophagaceae bacterium]|nr:YaiO family outer membrane beta-barrel protein [Chitinophagaceae bacterium]